MSKKLAAAVGATHVGDVDVNMNMDASSSTTRSTTKYDKNDNDDKNDGGQKVRTNSLSNNKIPTMVDLLSVPLEILFYCDTMREEEEVSSSSFLSKRKRDEDGDPSPSLKHPHPRPKLRRRRRRLMQTEALAFIEINSVASELDILINMAQSLLKHRHLLRETMVDISKKQLTFTSHLNVIHAIQPQQTKQSRNKKRHTTKKKKIQEQLTTSQNDDDDDSDSGSSSSSSSSSSNSNDHDDDHDDNNNNNNDMFYKTMGTITAGKKNADEHDDDNDDDDDDDAINNETQVHFLKKPIFLLHETEDEEDTGDQVKPSSTTNSPQKASSTKQQQQQPPPHTNDENEKEEEDETIQKAASRSGTTTARVMPPYGLALRVLVPIIQCHGVSVVEQQLQYLATQITTKVNELSNISQTLWALGEQNLALAEQLDQAMESQQDDFILHNNSSRRVSNEKRFLGELEDFLHVRIDDLLETLSRGGSSASASDGGVVDIFAIGTCETTTKFVSMREWSQRLQHDIFGSTTTEDNNDNNRDDDDAGGDDANNVGDKESYDYGKSHYHDNDDDDDDEGNSLQHETKKKKTKLSFINGSPNSTTNQPRQKNNNEASSLSPVSATAATTIATATNKKVVRIQEHDNSNKPKGLDQNGGTAAAIQQAPSSTAHETNGCDNSMLEVEGEEPNNGQDPLESNIITYSQMDAASVLRHLRKD